MRPVFAAVLAAAVLAPAAIAAAQGWTTQTFAAEGFSIEAPVVLERQPPEPIEGAGTMQVFFGRSETMAFMTSAISTPGVPGAETATPDEVVQSVMDGALQGETLVSQRPSSFAGGAARDFTARSADGVMTRNRVVFRRPWIYSSLVIVDADNAAALDGADATRFLNSIKPTR